MDITRIATENPKEEQWRLLSQFAYPTNIRTFLTERGFVATNDETVEYVAGCVQQGRAYFVAFETAPLDISPLLLYYGATNLLAGAATLLNGVQLPIHEHGMKLQTPLPTRIADVQVRTVNPGHGALQQFSNVFSSGCQIGHGSEWIVEEMFASIPDVRREYLNQYQGTPFTIPVEIIRQRQGTLERILPVDVERFPSVDEALDRIENLRRSYLRPQSGEKFITLNCKFLGPDIGIYSIAGQKYLQLCHEKTGQQLNPAQIILMFMGLFALGYLSRYHPERWNPFVRSDVTGERLVIEKFLDVCARYLPNLILNELGGQRTQFVYETEKAQDLTSSLTESDIKRIINEMRQTGEAR